MAGKARGKAKAKTKEKPRVGFRRWALRAVLVLSALLVMAILGYRFINPPTTPYMMRESRRLDGVAQEWVPMERIAPVMARAAVAAEDANFCRHWGFDMAAIRGVIARGEVRGASTISQQVVKNVYLWQGRSWPRKALEAILTPAVEIAWPKQRILEVYLNVAEFGEGVFGVEAAAQRSFGISAEQLSSSQAARLAAVLPDPKRRDAGRPSDFVTLRARSIADGAATIRRDGRAACFGADG